MTRDSKHSGRIAIVVIFLAVCAGLYTWLYIIPGITGALTRTAVVSHGHLRVTDETICFIVRSERVFTAGQSGGISYYVDEGAKTRKGTKILDVYPAYGSVAGYHASQTGVVSYYIDGFESYFSPDAIASLNQSELEAMEPVPENTRREQAIAGEPLYKMVFDDTWYVVIPLTEERKTKYKIGAAVTIEFDDGSVPAQAVDIVDREDTRYAILKTDRYYANFASIRKASIAVVTEDYEGLIIPNTAISWEEGIPGVYVRDLSGSFHFTKIKVITTDGKDSLIQAGSFVEADDAGNQVKVNTVEIYDEILRHSETKE